MKKLNDKLSKLADAAFLQASHKVVERAIRCGTPVITLRNGEMVKLDPRTIRLPKLPAAKRKRKRKS
jgi:hypothetical protein